MKNSKTNKLLSVLLAVLMVVSMFPVTAFAVNGVTWTKVDFADITADDTVMITMTNPHGVTYALPSNVSAKNPADVVTVEGNSIVTASADYGWKISAVDGGYTISSATGYLNSIDNNNGVRVDATKGVWNLDGNYLRTSDGTNNRWLGVYDNNNGDYSVSANWRAYKNTTGNTKNQTVGFWKLGGGSSAPVEPEEPEAIIADGDYVIWAPAYNKALSTQKTGYYNVGVDVALSGEKLTGYGETEIWTVTNNEDGTVTIANGGQKLSMAASNSSMTMDAVNDTWEIVVLGDDLYNVKNVGRGNFMEWYAKFSNWSTYNSSYAATDDQFQLAFYA
ncbi:MAG: hypothetical protein IJP05_03705, partial [Oscillospiraceae bacterium]|nr:hypothetical protein [Oscillospiraceae bacterium]